MKKTTLLLSATLLLCSYAFGQQDSSGIYNTVDDYLNHKLTYPVNYKLEKQRIKEHLFLQASQIKVKHNGQTHVLDKNNLYGFRNSRGHDFRFVGDRVYRIMNAGEPIILYKYGEPGRDPAAKASTEMNRYYFSINETNSPVSLTRENLKKSFPGNTKFHEALDKKFTGDYDLARFDKANNTYMIITLLKDSMSNQ
ncbi:MAG TPA: hypothetical protein VGE66_14445 [Chitinophagaceae bacterium]